MQPVEDLWTCNRCGWTYPNHHPSAKHRRNHKKVCGKVPGHTIDDHHEHGNGGSSDEASSGDEHSGHHEVKVTPVAEVVATTPAPAPLVESQPRSFDLTVALQKPSESATSTPADARAPVEETKAPVQEALKAEEPVKEAPTPVLRSAVPHPEDDIWICRECGWTYPNAHPSAKHRRNHKKHCPGKAGAKEHVPGGSSDEDSDGEHHHAPKAAETTEKVNVAAPAAPVAEPEEEKAVPELSPVVSATREFSLGSVVPKEEAAPAKKEVSPEKVEEAAKTVEATPVAAPTTPATPPAPVVAPKAGSAIPHPDDDIWICKECGWTYPNHHPSAKHRRNHKKQCPGKKAAPAHAPGGSSDEDSGDENHHQAPVQASEPEVTNVTSEAPPSVSREFNLEWLKPATNAEVKDAQAPAEKAAVKETEKETPAEAAAAAGEGTPVTLPPSVVSEAPKEETPAVDSKEVKKDEVSVAPSPGAPEVGSAIPHPEEDIWICRECGWTYPNHHPSAKHRRNHKKNCPGKVAAAAPAPGGSSDEDSGDEHHHHQTSLHAPKAELVNTTSEAPSSGITFSREFSLDSLAKTASVPQVKAEQPENGHVELAKSLSNGVPPLKTSSAAPAVVSNEVAKEEIPAQAPSSVESKEVSKKSIPVATPVVKEEALSVAPSVVPSDPTKDKSLVRTAARKVGSAVPRPEDDIWICKECGWTYPNHHPSAKHRRNHKKVCSGKVAAAAPAPGGSSDEDSGDEHHHHPLALHATKPEVVNGTNEAPPVASVSREFNVESLAIEPTPAEAKIEVVKTPKAQAPADTSTVHIETSPAVGLKEAPNEEIPAVVSSETTKDEKPVEASAPLVAKEETSSKSQKSKKELKAAKASAAPAALGSAVPHYDGDTWKCRECDWTYPNAHPSAKHRRNHKKHCPGKAAAAAAAPAQGGSSDDDSDHDNHPCPPATEATPVVASVPTEPVASVLRDFQLPTAEVKEEATSATSSAPKVEVPPASLAPLEEVKAPAAVESSPPAVPAPAPKVSSAAPHPEDPNDIWICKACNWTYPNAHPSAKHRRNHKKQCSGTPAAVAPGPGGSSDEDSDHEHSSTGKTPATSRETAPVEAPVETPVIKGRGVLNLGAHSPDKVVEADQSPKVDAVETVSSASVNQSREQEAKGKEELKKSEAAVPKAPHDPSDIWVCQQCGWTYPNAHPSAKHRRNHKKVCKKVPIAGAAAGGGSSSDASSDDDVGHFGKKKCFPCLS